MVCNSAGSAAWRSPLTVRRLQLDCPAIAQAFADWLIGGALSKLAAAGLELVGFIADNVVTLLFGSFDGQQAAGLRSALTTRLSSNGLRACLAWSLNILLNPANRPVLHFPSCPMFQSEHESLPIDPRSDHREPRKPMRNKWRIGRISCRAWKQWAQRIVHTVGYTDEWLQCTYMYIAWVRRRQLRRPTAMHFSVPSACCPSTSSSSRFTCRSVSTCLIDHTRHITRRLCAAGIVEHLQRRGAGESITCCLQG